MTQRDVTRDASSSRRDNFTRAKWREISSRGLEHRLPIAYSKQMGYSKLHSSLVTSSLWTEPDHVRILFITLLAMCDKDGCVYGSRRGLERIAMLDPSKCEERDPWHALLSPDPDSCDRMRAPENQGRRIEEIPGGFRLLNFAYYRGLRNDDDRAEQNRQAQIRHRERTSGKQKSASVSRRQPPSATVSHGQPPSAHTEAEAEAEAEAPTHTNREDLVCAVVEHHRRHHPEMVHSIEPVRALIKARLKDGFTVEALKKAIDGQARGEFYRGGNKAGVAFLSMNYLFESDERVRRAMAEADTGEPSKERDEEAAARQEAEIRRTVDEALSKPVPPPPAPPRVP